MFIGIKRFKSVAVLALITTAFGCSDSLDKEAELQATMRGDLARLATAQEASLQATGAYNIDASAIMEPTPGISLRVLFVSAGTWGAEAATAESQNHCAMFIGAGEQSFLARWVGITPNEVTCKPLPVGTGK